MATPFEALAGLDRLIHEPGRLAILTALGACKRADFLFLQNLTGLTKGNLSTHLTKLEESGMVTVTKEFVGKKPVTLISLTEAGRTAVDEYWQRMHQLRQDVEQWQGEQQD